MRSPAIQIQQPEFGSGINFASNRWRNIAGVCGLVSPVISFSFFYSDLNFLPTVLTCQARYTAGHRRKKRIAKLAVRPLAFGCVLLVTPWALNYWISMLTVCMFRDQPVGHGFLAESGWSRPSHILAPGSSIFIMHQCVWLLRA